MTTTRTSIGRAAAIVLTIALVSGAAVAGRSLHSHQGPEVSTAPVIADPGASPGPPTTATEALGTAPSTEAAAPAELPASLDVEPLVYDTSDAAGGAPAGGGITANVGVPTLGAGAPLANPGGTIDLRADPEAAITGDVPVGPAPLSDGDADDRSDSDALSAVTEISASLAPSADALDGAPLGPPAGSGGAATIPAFVDPCVSDSPSGCEEGLEGVILGQIARPALITHWSGEVVSNNVYAGECRRQIPGLDFRTSTVFAIVVNLPYSGTMNVQFFLAQPDTRAPDAGLAYSAAVAPSAQLNDAWSAEYSSTRRTLQVPLCIRIDDVEQNLGSCPAELLVPIGYARQCRSQVEMSVQGLDDLGHTWGAGLYRIVYRYDVSRDGGGDRASLRRPVRLTPIDERLIEVAVPIQHSAFGELTGPDANTGDAGTLRAHLVTAAAYPGRTKCASVDPARNAPSVQPVSHQIAATRYWTPDPSQPSSREAVVLLNLPSALAAGEAVVICVFWYTFDGASYDAPVVMAIERHEVIAPGRAVTEMRMVGFGEAEGWFALPHATPLAARDPNLLRLSFLENSALNRRCGFSGPNGRSPVVTPLGDSSLVCRIDTPAFFTEPRNELLYVELTGQLEGRDVAGPMSWGQRTVRIDNRGCGPDGCGPVRRERWNFWDGRWVDLSFTRVPFATTAVLPNGLAYADGWDPNGWTIDSSGFVSETPALATDFPVFGSDTVAPPQIDTSTLRLVRDVADPMGTLVLTWRASRAAQSTMVVRPRFAGSEAACPAVTSAPNTEFAVSGRLAASGLCPGTQYVATLQLTDTTNGTDRRVTEFAFDGGRNPGLAEDTARRVPPDDFDYGWSLTVSNPAGRGRSVAAVSDLVVRLGGYTLTSQPGTSTSSCRSIEAATSLASGTRGADRVIGEVLVSVSLTLTGSTTPTEPGEPCGIGGGLVNRIDARWFAHWDGRATTLSQTLSDGTVVELTLRPVTD